MRKALWLAFCSLTIPNFRKVLHTKSESEDSKATPKNEPSKNLKPQTKVERSTPDPTIPRNLRVATSYHEEFKPLYGYDVYHKRIKELPTSVHRMLRPKLRTRAEHLNALKKTQEFDILIIGGGITGAGALLEASNRGLTCALIDRGDFGAESTSRSTKLTQGRIKYIRDIARLERGIIKRFKLIMEGLDERNYILNSAAYLNKDINMVIPCNNVLKAALYYVGLNIYHLLSYFLWAFGDYSCKFPRPSLVSRERMNKLLPMLKNKAYGVKFTEGQVNDTRLLIQNLLTASQEQYVEGMKGATLGNYIEFVDFVKDDKGKCIGATLIDKVTGDKLNVKAKVIINCTGAFSDEIRRKDNPKATPRIVGSRGVHIVLPPNYTGKNLGIVIPNKNNGGLTFVLPYQGMTIAGATDHECDIKSAPIAPKEDIKEIEKELKTHFTYTAPLKYSAAWCGIRPLLSDNRQTSLLRRLLSRREYTTQSFLRNHAIEVSSSGLISLMGGNLTVYRKMGQSVIETVLKNHPEIIPCRKASATRDMRLIGAYTDKTFISNFGTTEKDVREFIGYYKRILHEKHSLDWDVAGNLVDTYGTQAVRVVSLGTKRGMNERLHKDYPYTKAQVLYAIEKELATNVRDVVFRRLGVAFIDKQVAEEIIPVVAGIMGKEMGWNKERVLKEIQEAKNSLQSLA